MKLFTLSTIGFILLSSPIHSQENFNTECSHETLLVFFPSIFVKETLSHFKVPENQWEGIISKLKEIDQQKKITKIVEDKASQLNPNPLKDPQQRQLMVKIYRDTIFETFSEVMKAHGVTDAAQIQAMLDDIQKQQAKRFAQCMQKKHTEMKTE